MKYLGKEKDLINKKIIFTHMPRFAEQITIVVENEETKEKEIFMCEQDDNGTYVLIPNIVRRRVLDDRYLRNTLNDLGIITDKEIEEYEVFLKEQFKKKQEEARMKSEKDEYNLYLKLKEKYKDR